MAAQCRGPGPSPRATVASVIIPCYNEAACIGRCLDAHASQSCGPLQVIIVDDGSSDATLSIIEQVRRSFPWELLVLRQQHQGPARARNLAVSQAIAPILVFTDADMVPSPSYVEKLIAPILAGRAAGSFPLEEWVGNRGNYWADAWSLAGGCRIGHRVPDGHPPASKVFRALLRAEFERVGGFGDRGIGGVGEDQTLAEKLGYLAVDAPGAVVYHDNPATLADFWASALWYGKGWYFDAPLAKLCRGLLKHALPLSLARHLLSGAGRYLPALLVYDTAVVAGILRGRGTRFVAK